MKFNKDKNIGRVLFIVEGSKTEFSILKRIFCDILKYNYIAKKRNRLNTFVKENNSKSYVAVINTRESNIKDISNNTDYLDKIFEILINEYNFPVDKAAIYYLFDRDPLSNTNSNLVRYYINKLNNPYDNEDSNYSGQLLLSYPCIECFIVSNFQEDITSLELGLGKEIKQYIYAQKYMQINKIDENTLINATNEFINYLDKYNIALNIDDFRDSSIKIFDQQESNYQNKKHYRLLSLLTLAFLQLGIIALE